jgi:putative acetyltransferase
MWTVKLKDGRQVAIRPLTVNDRDKLFSMFNSMSIKALEYSAAPYTMDVIDRWVNNIQSMIAFVAKYAHDVVGYASIYKFPRQRMKGIGDLAIYVHQDFHRVGLGTALTEKLLEQARKDGMHRIHLSVVAENVAAIELYRKFGFKAEGTPKDAFFGFDNKYHDMINMGLILE